MTPEEIAREIAYSDALCDRLPDGYHVVNFDRLAAAIATALVRFGDTRAREAREQAAQKLLDYAGEWDNSPINSNIGSYLRGYAAAIRALSD
jgi:hypothetical protein